MHILESSFRDPSGHVFNLNDQFYRAVHSLYQNNFENDFSFFFKTLELIKVEDSDRILYLM